MEKSHRALPSRDDTARWNIVTTLGHPESNTLNIRFRIVRSDKEQLHKKTSRFGADQNIQLAWMRHHGFETEAAPLCDT